MEAVSKPRGGVVQSLQEDSSKLMYTMLLVGVKWWCQKFVHTHIDLALKTYSLLVSLGIHFCGPVSSAEKRTQVVWTFYHVVHFLWPESGSCTASVFGDFGNNLGTCLCIFPRIVNEHAGTFAAISVAVAVDVLGKVPRRNLKRFAHRLVHCFIRFGSGPPAETGGMPLGKV